MPDGVPVATAMVPLVFNVNPLGTVTPDKLTCPGFVPITAGLPSNVSFAITDNVVSPAVYPLIKPNVSANAHKRLLTVTAEPEVIQVVSVVDRTRNVYVPGATPVKVALDW